MARQKNSFSPEFKMQVVLETFQNKETLVQLASRYNTSVKNIENWREQFLQNAHLAFNSVAPLESVASLKKENSKLEKMLEKTRQETKEAADKLKQLDITTKKQLIDTTSSSLSIAQQCKIIDLNRPSLYYEPKPSNSNDEIIMQRICEIYNHAQSSKGYRAMHQKLIEEGFKIGVNKVHKLMKILEEQNALSRSSNYENQPNKVQVHSRSLHDLALIKPYKL